MPKETWQCDFCNKEFKAYASQSTTYCSRECHNKDRRDRLKKNCEVCGDSFETVPSDDCDTCSPKCGSKLVSKKLRNEKVECDNPDCTNEFSPRHGEKFCCYECSIGNRDIDGRTLVTLVCKYCEAEYERKPSKVEGSSFCSLECKSDWQSENLCGSNNPNWNSVEKECIMCGQSFFVWKSKEDKIKCCSRECSDDYKSEFIVGENHPRYSKVEKECAFCEEIFMVYNSTFDRRKCCSMDCLGKYREENWHGKSHPNWKKDGGNRYYGASWVKNREKAFRRDDGQCSICGKGKEDLGREPDVHHIKPLRNFDDKKKGNSLDNLITLCSEHHGLVEGWNLVPSNIKR